MRGSALHLKCKIFNRTKKAAEELSGRMVATGGKGLSLNPRHAKIQPAANFPLQKAALKYKIFTWATI